MEPKKTILYRILGILERYSDAEHPLTQNEIISRLSELYEIECDRKTIGRNISVLKEMGFEIDNAGRSGVYLSQRKFEPSELRILIDGVMCSRYFNGAHSRDLIEKLVDMGGVRFKNRVKHVYRDADWGKSTNLDFMLNVEIVDEAIENGVRVAFYYNKYDYDKKLHKTTEKKHIVSPYQMLLQNQHYYLAGNLSKYDNITFFRMDKITDIELTDEKIRPIQELPGYEKGLNIAELVTTLPYMFADKREFIRFKCQGKIIDDVIDRFGTGIHILKSGENYIVTVKTSPNAMLYWLLQYGQSVEVVEPESLRQRLIQSLEKTLSAYKRGL